MTRDCPVGQDYFAENKDRLIPLLMKLIDHEDHQASTKAIVVLRHLAEANDSIRDAAVEAGAVSALDRCVQQKDADESQQEMAVLALEQLRK